jgi:hypothetical protein
MFAVELAAEEAAAAAAAAAEEAAAVAAQQAATEAAAQQAATGAATRQAAQQTAQAGIMDVGGATANTAAPLTTPEAVQAAARQAGQNVAPETITRGIQTVPDMPYMPEGGVPPQGIVPPEPFNPYTAPLSNANYFTQGMPQLQASPAYSLNSPSASIEGFKAGANAGVEGFKAAPTAANSLYNGYQPSALERGMNTAVQFAKDNPFTTMMGASMGAQALGLIKPNSFGGGFGRKEYDGPLSRYKLSPDFKGSTANPVNFQYNPKGYAGGGIMNASQMNPNTIAVGYDGGGDIPQYAKGGSLTDSIEQYQKMLSGAPQAAPTERTDVGIFHDTDPDTRYQDALTAAQIRQSKINQRAYVSPPVAKRPTPMGQLQMASVKPRKQGGADDVEAAQGGIMHSSLGGYAAGGNPRLLQGPGDGMSDNIPATINGRQPARLADGEFVIPADVVSHLGNGSTEAGAKQLHAMMDKVRSARTGNSKQGKQINPKKYMPK